MNSLTPTLIPRAFPSVLRPGSSKIDEVHDYQLKAQLSAASIKSKGSQKSMNVPSVQLPKLELTEREEDYFDALSPINDMLRIAKGW